MPNLLIRKFVYLKDNNEQAGMLWATAYGFFIMFSYYILRAVRDEISSADRGNLQILWTVVFLAMMVAVPLYSWITSRFSRGVFVPLANRFFIACLVGFWLCLSCFRKMHGHGLTGCSTCGPVSSPCSW